jgi:hypothetical protein
MEEKGRVNFPKERNVVVFRWASFSQVVDWQMDPSRPMITCKLITSKSCELIDSSHMAWPLKQLGGGSLPFDDVNYHKCPPSYVATSLD